MPSDSVVQNSLQLTQYAILCRRPFVAILYQTHINTKGKLNILSNAWDQDGYITDLFRSCFRCVEQVSAVATRDLFQTYSTMVLIYPTNLA